LVGVEGNLDIVVEANDDLLEQHISVVIAVIIASSHLGFVFLLLEEHALCLVEVLGDGTSGVRRDDLAV